MRLEVVAQHDEVVMPLLRKPILLSDDLMVKSSGALCDKEAWIAAIFLPIWENLPFRSRYAMA